MPDSSRALCPPRHLVDYPLPLLLLCLGEPILVGTFCLVSREHDSLDAADARVTSRFVSAAEHDRQWRAMNPHGTREGVCIMEVRERSERERDKDGETGKRKI